MKLMHPLFSSPVCFRENRIPVLVVENPLAFRKLVRELILQSEGYEGPFVLSVNDKPLECAGHLNVYQDFIHIHEIEKRIQTRALNGLLQGVQEQLMEDSFHLTEAIQNYLGKLSTLAEYPVSFEHADLIPALVKAADFRIDLQGLPACEALYEHISLFHSLFKNQCTILINAHSFFPLDEIKQLYHVIQYRKIPLMLFEAHAVVPLEMEDICIFDQDLCELRLEENEFNG